MRFPACLAPLAFLTLAACIDADVALDFQGGGQVEAIVETEVSRQLFDMMGKTPEAACKEGKGELTADNFSCRIVKSMTVDELIADVARKNADADPLGLSGAGQIERLDENRLRVTFDFSTMMSGRDDLPDAGQLAAMGPMLKAAVAGRSLTFTIKGHKIIDTTGTLSEDGTTATRILPIAALLDAKPDLGPAFVTTVQTDQSCVLWVFCD